MEPFDLVIRGGTVVTSAERTICDVGVRDGLIAALANALPSGRREIDASGKLILPGGVEAHCHLEQTSSAGLQTADDFYSGSVAAAFGGTTTVIPFAAQHRGQSLLTVVRECRERAEEKAVIDYGFHLIVSDPNKEVLEKELPALVDLGCPSFKVFMTSEKLRVDDYQFLDVLAVARRSGALTMVHAENHYMLRWMAERLLARGHRAPKFLAMACSRLAEAEATNRAIRLAEFVDAPIMIVHVSCPESMTPIRHAQARGLKVYAETCPQYLFLTARDLDRPGAEGAKFCFAPPARDEAAAEAVWTGLTDGTFQIFCSDHAPYRFDESGKLYKGPDPAFNEVGPGTPGIELRLALLFSEGVRRGRLTLERFVALTATNAARIYGLYPRKGTIAIGSDADMAIWDPEKTITVTADLLHDRTGYTPYEGRQVTGWPTTVISGGRVVVDGGELLAERGSGRFLPRVTSDDARPLGRLVPEMDPGRNFGAKILD